MLCLRAWPFTGQDNSNSGALFLLLTMQVEDAADATMADIYQRAHREDTSSKDILWLTETSEKGRMAAATFECFLGRKNVIGIEVGSCRLDGCTLFHASI